MNLFTRKIPYYHLLKYLLFLLKHPVYVISGVVYSFYFVNIFLNVIIRKTSPYNV